MSISSLVSLLRQTNIDDDEQVLHAAEAQLKQSKTDLEAQHVKVVALLKLDRYDDALRALDSGGDKLKERALLEHAYALYKSGKPSAAAELAQRSSQRGLKHVEAQASYRSEDFVRAAELYKELAERPGEDAEADLRINAGATDAQLEWSGRGGLVQNKKPTREDLGAFETAYNAACGSIARGELAQAEVLLKRAADLCASSDDLSEEDKEAESVPIRVQRTYVLARLGRLEEAEQLAQTVDAKSISDPVTRLVAEVNKITTTPTDNPFLVQRLLATDVESLKPDYPFHFQAAVLRQNSFVSDLQALKYAGTADSTNYFLKKQSSANSDALSNSISVINAAATAKGQNGKDALKHILPILERRPNDIGLLLTIVQLYVTTGNAASAITLLETFLSRLDQAGAEHQDARYAPGLVAAAVSLYHSQGRKSSVQTELAQAALHWRRESKERPAGYVHLAKAAGSSLLSSTNPEHMRLARDIFEELRAADSSDRYAAAGLLASTPENASAQDVASLNSIDRLTSGIDVDALENAGIAQPATTGSAPVSRKRPAEDAKPKKVKKIRKSRMPKDFDPNKKPDPERWLSLRDRSTYRPKGKKAKARQALFSQGAVANESEASRPATPGGDIVKPKQAGGGGQNKKKKGKGGKW